ncbi:MAG: MFS transporter [Candidatus Helarchaeota archaeon]
MNKRTFLTVILFVIIASLDNTALGLMPAIMKSIAKGVGIDVEKTAFIAFIVAGVHFVTALTSFFWGYWGDKYNRKKLLVYGTILWIIFIFLSTFAQTFTQLLILQLLAGIGLGCIASVGFSVIVDFISPKRRGLALSFWGISQGLGAGVGSMMAVLFNVSLGWNAAFLILSLITTGFLMAYILIAIEPERGATEEELQELFQAKSTYEFRIKREDLRYILKIKTNKFLIFQALFAYISIGGTMILPIVFTFKIIATGVPDAPAEILGPIFAGIFEMGYGFAFIFGWLGDKYQKKTLKARSIVSAVAVLIGVPLSIAVILIPLHFPGVPNTNDVIAIVSYLNSQFLSNPAVLLVLILSIFAAVFISAIDPNFFALIGDVNLPEHRGTMFGFSNFIAGTGRAIGIFLMAGLQLLFLPYLSLDMTWIWAFICILLFFIPTGICFALSARSAPNDIMRVKKVLANRTKIKIEAG